MTKYKAMKFTPKTPADALALEIAKGFNDEKRLPLYRQICSGHSQSLVYRAFKETMNLPLHKIKKSRRALFIFLIKKYENKT